MATRALAGALLAALLASPAFAQAVPPAKRFVGPPVELAGSDPATPPAAATPAPAIPGGMAPLPKSKFVGPPAPEPPVFDDGAKNAFNGVSNAAKYTGKAAGVVKDGAEFYGGVLSAADGLDSSKPPLTGGVSPDVTKAGKIAEIAEDVGKGATIVGAAAGTMTAAAKCTDAKATNADCVQAGLNVTASYANVADAVAGSNVTGKTAGALGLASSAMSLDKACRGKDAEAGKCIVAGIDTTMSAANLVPVLKPMTTTYSVGMVVGNAVMAGAEKVLDQPVGAYIYDKANPNETKKAFEAANSQSNLDAQRARRHAAYATAAGGLISRQQAADEQRAALAREQQAAANQAYVNAQEAAQMQALTNGLTSAIQASAARSAAPVSGGGGATSGSSAPPARIPGCRRTEEGMIGDDCPNI